MFTCNLDPKSKVPLYQQLYEYIQNSINNGELKAEEKLPSKRKLSQHLKISVITIENAYEQLITEGYIYSKPQKGFYRPEGSVVCSPCCIFHNGHGCQFFRRPWLFLFPASVAWDAVSRQSVYAGTPAAGVDRTSIGRGPTHTTYPLGDILQPESGENFPPCGSPAPLQW